MAETDRSKIIGSEVLADPEGVKQTSQSLILQVKDHDPAAWERLVKLYSPLVYFWCQESGLPKPDVSDVFQDVFTPWLRTLRNSVRSKTAAFEAGSER